MLLKCGKCFDWALLEHARSSRARPDELALIANRNRQGEFIAQMLHGAAVFPTCRGVQLSFEILYLTNDAIV